MLIYTATYLVIEQLINQAAMGLTKSVLPVNGLSKITVLNKILASDSNTKQKHDL